jgi:hypothetical protein
MERQRQSAQERPDWVNEVRGRYTDVERKGRPVAARGQRTENRRQKKTT